MNQARRTGIVMPNPGMLTLELNKDKKDSESEESLSLSNRGISKTASKWQTQTQDHTQHFNFGIEHMSPVNKLRESRNKAHLEIIPDAAEQNQNISSQQPETQRLGNQE